MRWWFLLSALWVLATPMSSALAELDELRFRATNLSDVDFFRLFVGQQSGRYPVRISLHDVSFDSGGIATARVPEFRDIFEPGERYFLAMTTVSLAGVQSELSQEFVLDVPALQPTPDPTPPPGSSPSPGTQPPGGSQPPSSTPPAPQPTPAPMPSVPGPSQPPGGSTPTDPVRSPAPLQPSGEVLQFRVEDPSTVDFFRVFVGIKSGLYGTIIVVDDATIDASGVATARVPEFATLFRPGFRYFIATQTVNARGQFSALSRELVVDIPSVPDRDRDGIPDSEDNCPFIANPSQSDRGGVASVDDPMGLRPDGIGDVCQCGDVVIDGRVTRADALALFEVLVRRQQRFAALSRREGRTVFEPFITRTCNVDGDGLCDGADVFAIASAALGRVSLAQSCQAASPR